MGDVGCFSFYPTKPLGAIGDGGLVTTDDGEVAVKIRQLRNHGRTEQNVHLIPGYTSRLDEVQAVALAVKLKHLDEWNSRRRDVAEKYDKLLEDLAQVQTPYCIPSAEHVYHLYVIRFPKRDALRAKLRDLGIETSIHYPTPIHLQPPYKGSYSSRLRNGEKAAKEILSLPMFAELTDEEVKYVSDAVHKYL